MQKSKQQTHTHTHTTRIFTEFVHVLPHGVLENKDLTDFFASPLLIGTPHFTIAHMWHSGICSQRLMKWIEWAIGLLILFISTYLSSKPNYSKYVMDLD